MVRIIAVCLALLAAGGCVSTAAPPPRAQASGIDGTYAVALARQYQTMAALFGVNGRNALSARFQVRGAAAMAGEWVAPEPAPSDMADPDLARAREVLVMALSRGMTPDNALWLARAQVNYECWAATGEGSCRADFQKAMRSLTLPAAALQTQSVYFDRDSSELSADARRVLTDIAGMMRMDPAIDLRLIGSADHLARNPSLALRRAIAARNLLVQMGIPNDRILVKDEDHGETILGEQTPETGSDPATRRVDIVIEPLYGQAI